MKKSKRKKLQIMRSASSKERALRIKQQVPKVFKPYINHKIMNNITIDLIKTKIRLIRDELTWIENHLSSIQKEVNDSDANGVTAIAVKPPAQLNLDIKVIASSNLNKK